MGADRTRAHPRPGRGVRASRRRRPLRCAGRAVRARRRRCTAATPPRRAGTTRSARFLTGTGSDLKDVTAVRLIRHHVSNLRIEVESPEVARGASYFFVVTDRGPDHWGRYRDEYVCRDGRWLFRHRRARLDGYAPGLVVGRAARPPGAGSGGALSAAPRRRRPRRALHTCATTGLMCNVRAVAPSAKSLILDLLSTLKGGALPVRALVGAAALFGISENSTRRGARPPARARHGHQRRARALPARRAAPRRSTGSRPRGATSSAACAPGPGAGSPSRPATSRGRRAAAARAPSPSSASATCAATSPCGPTISSAASPVRASGSPSSASTRPRTSSACTISHPATAQRAARLWDTAAIRLALPPHDRRARAQRARARARCRATRRWPSRSCSAGAPSARSCSTRACPTRWCRRAERRALIDALLRYDRAGRGRWASFLREMGGTPGRTPAHVRFCADHLPDNDSLSGDLDGRTRYRAPTAAAADPPRAAASAGSTRCRVPRSRSWSRTATSSRGSRSLLDWGTIFAAMAMVAAWPNVLTDRARAAADRHAPARHGDPDARRRAPRAVLEPRAQRLGRQLAVRLSDLDRHQAVPALPPEAPRQELHRRGSRPRAWCGPSRSRARA